MLEAYFEAFEAFLRTGDPRELAGFTDGSANPAFLSVYRNGHIKTCTDTLAASYPVVRALVGDDYFRGLARAYVDTYPPASGTLVGYGGHFAEFVRLRSEEHGLVYLADAASIDAAWLASLFAGGGVALTAVDVERMSSEGIDLSAVRAALTPPTQLVRLTHHIAETWALIREQGALSSGVSLREGENIAMVWRVGGRIHIKELDPGESMFLCTLAEGAPLGVAATGALEVDESFDLAVTFAALLQNHILQLEGHDQ